MSDTSNNNYNSKLVIAVITIAIFTRLFEAVYDEYSCSWFDGLFISNAKMSPKKQNNKNLRKGNEWFLVTN
jgi:hypothetical protein